MVWQYIDAIVSRRYIFFGRTIDVFAAESWMSMSMLEDPKLKLLGKRLQSTLFESRASGTVRKYCYAFGRWRAWAKEKEIQLFPVLPEQLCLYLQHLGDTTGSKSAVTDAINAISWLHQIAGEPSIAGHPLVLATSAAFTRILAKPVRKKEPVSLDMLNRMIVTMQDPPTLSELRTVAASLLAFSGFLRFDELLKLQCNDIEFLPQHMNVRIQSSKTDQYRKGDRIMIARSSLRTCPVAMLERYVQVAGVDIGSTERLFRGITKTKNGEKLRATGSISYTRMREVILAKWREMGIDASSYGLHSFRAGGATAAANAHVPDRLFKRHGRWKTESAKDGYVKDTDEEMLSVSKQLGL